MAMRTPREVFHHHFAALQAGDVDDVMSDYSRDSVVITPGGAARGIAAIRQGITMLLAEIPEAKWQVKTQIYDDCILFLQWAAHSKTTKVEDGVETYLFKDGLIHTQTVHFTLCNSKK